MDYKPFPYPKEIMDPDWLESRKELQLASSDNHESFMVTDGMMENNDFYHPKSII